MKTRMLVVVALIIGAANLNAAVISVTSVADNGPGTLRAALANAANGDVIDATGVSGTILLTSGELFVTKSVFLLGPGPAALAINGNHATRVFHVGSNTVVKIFSLTITNGLAAGAGFPNESGSAVYNDRAVLTLVSCAISGNSFTNGNLLGAAIYNDGRTNSATVTIANCTLSGNTGTNGGVGAVYNYGEFGGTATVTIVNSTLNSNFGETAGGVYNDGGYGGSATMTIANSVVSNNSSSFEGGGIYNNGLEGSATLIVSNCIFSGNSAWSYGGAIENNGGSGIATLTIVNSSFNSNSGFEGAGVFNDGSDGGLATLIVSNCLFTGNSSGNNGVYDYGVIANYVENYGNATLMVNNSTLSNNLGVGIDNKAYDSGPASVTTVNSTISGNLGGVISQGGGAQLTISNSVIDDNSVFGFGGGVGNGYGSQATIIHSLISGNSSVGGGAAGAGGGVANYDGTLIIVDTMISSNSATIFGGGIVNEGWLTVSNSTLYGNMSIGGAIFNNGTLTIANSTLSSNSASGGDGGGIYNSGSDIIYGYPGVAILIVANCTLSGNSGAAGAGIYNDGSAGSATLEIGGTILNDNDAGGNITNDSGSVTSDGYNLSSDAAGGDGSTGPGGLLNSTGDIRNTDPMLGPLQDNGGPTFTHALLPGSPAIDAGDPNFVPPPDYDQRGPGFPRVIANWSGSPRIDIGAFEASPTYSVGDGIPDSWRARYFANQPSGNSDGTATNGRSCVTCDADGTGQNNLFKYTAGLDPTNPASIFVLKIASVVGQPTYKDLIFNPEVSGRTYTTEFTTNLVGTPYATLPDVGGPTTNGTEVTVTDTNAVEPQKFYRISISLP